MQRIETRAGSLDVGGARLAYDVAGQGDALVLVHGGLGDRTMWDEQFAAFARRYRTVRFDLRGMGDSSRPAGTYNWANDIRGVMQGLGIERAHIAGISFGGLQSIDFALAYPEMVETLILVDTALRGYDFTAETGRRIEEADETLMAGDLDRGVEMELRIWIDGPHRTPGEVNPEVREKVRAMNRRNYEGESFEGEPELSEVTARDRIAEIRAPVLIVVGAEDVPDMHEIADILVREIPDALQIVIPGTAHHPQMEKPEEFNRVILEFLSKHEARSASDSYEEEV